MILHASFLLAPALLGRSKGSNQTENATEAAKFLRYLGKQPHVAHGSPRHAVMTLLVDVLAIQAGLGARAENGVQNIEMAVFCHEHLTLDASDSDTTRSTILFERAVLSKIKDYLCVPDQPLDQVIECPQLARAHKPELRDLHLA